MVTYKLVLRSNSQQGFALVIALLVGCTVTIIGLSMLLRTVSHNEFVTAQQQTAQAQTNAEIGVNRTRNQLHENTSLTTQNQSKWRAILDGSTPEDQQKQKLLRKCDSDQAWQQKVHILNPYVTGGFQAINGDNEGFRLKKYTFFPEQKKGQILVEGSARDATAYILAEFTVNFGELPFPVLWVGSQGAGIGTGKNYINGNLWGNKCDFPFDKVYFYSSQFKAEHTALDMPNLPNLNAIANRIPGDQKGLKLTDDSTDLTFPRPGDKVTYEFNGVSTYEYVVNSVDLRSKQLAVVTAGDGSIKVVFYTLGSIQGEIKHSCGGNTCKASDFMVLGYGGSGDANLDVYNPAPQICLRGSGDLPMFVFAPYYEMGMQKTEGGSYFNFQGAAWVAKWSVGGFCGEDRFYIQLSSSINWNDLPRDFWLNNPYPMMGSISRWNLVDINNIDNGNTSGNETPQGISGNMQVNSVILKPYQLAPDP